MAMDETDQNKSEEPTPFKLDRSRKKGVVARGIDLGFFSALASFFAIYWIGGRWVEGAVGLSVERTLIAAPHLGRSHNQLLHVIGGAFSAVVAPLALLAAAVFAVVLVLELVQTGPVFSTEPLRFDFGRLNPVNGFKRVFSFRTLIETGKTVLKAGLYAFLVWAVAQEALHLYFAAAVDANSLAEIARASALRLIGFAAVGAAGVAIIDQLISRRQFLRKMRMSRRELRREVREREGEPRQKQERKRMHAEMVKNNKSLRGVRGADVLITNPTHLAAALAYDESEIAPRVVAFGKGVFALRLKTLALTYGVTIIEDRELAKRLIGTNLDDFIPEVTFEKVAAIYVALKQEKGNPVGDAHVEVAR
jgi:flagellar biosynthetic protein FlhB